MVTWIQTKWFNFEFYGFLDICFFTDIHAGWSQLQKFMVKVWTWIFKTINDFVNWNLDGISNSLTDINCTFLEYKTLKWILQGHIFYTQAHRIKSRRTMVNGYGLFMKSRFIMNRKCLIIQDCDLGKDFGAGFSKIFTLVRIM